MSKHQSHRLHDNTLAAWQQHDNETREQAVLRILRSRGPMTDREVCAAIGSSDMNFARPTITKLHDNHRLYEYNRVKCPTTNRTVRVSWIRGAFGGEQAMNDANERMTEEQIRRLPEILTAKYKGERNQMGDAWSDVWIKDGADAISQLIADLAETARRANLAEQQRDAAVEGLTWLRDGYLSHPDAVRDFASDYINRIRELGEGNGK